MKIFQAVEKLKYMQPKPIIKLHSRVVELHPEETAAVVAFNEKIHQGVRNGVRVKEAKQEMKEYKCLDCGMVWKESIHSPDIVDTATINTYYCQHISCLAGK